MYNTYYSSPMITDCVFTANEAGYSGGMFNEDDSEPIITNCIFADNIAEAGGGMSNSYASPTLVNCIFFGNTADYGAAFDDSDIFPQFGSLNGGALTGRARANNEHIVMLHTVSLIMKVSVYSYRAFRRDS